MITLSYNGDLSRVQIGSTGLVVPEVRVEWSTNQMLWRTVRGGVALDSSGGAVALDDFELADGVINHYRLVDTADGSVQEADSITPSTGGVIWLKSIRHPFLNRPVTVVEFDDPARAARGTLAEVSGRSDPVSVTDVRASQEFQIEVQTTTAAQARDLDLMLASGDHFYLQVPPGCPVPGGYLTVGDTSQGRRTRSARSPRRYTTLPCRVAAPPAPEVVGTTLTWGTVFRLYGSWQALIAANPTWADLLATVGSEEDLVVL